MAFPDDNFVDTVLDREKDYIIPVKVGYALSEDSESLLPIQGKSLVANFIYTNSSTPLVKDAIIKKDNADVGGLEISSQVTGLVQITLTSEDLSKIEVTEGHFLYLLLQERVLTEYFGNKPSYIYGYIPIAGNKYLYRVQ